MLKLSLLYVIFLRFVQKFTVQSVYFVNFFRMFSIHSIRISPFFVLRFLYFSYTFTVFNMSYMFNLQEVNIFID